MLKLMLRLHIAKNTDSTTGDTERKKNTCSKCLKCYESICFKLDLISLILFFPDWPELIIRLCTFSVFPSGITFFFFKKKKPEGL